MTIHRLSTILSWALLLCSLSAAPAFAGFASFFGYGDDRGKSGLDFSHGYDLNTVTTVAGRVVSVNHAGEGDQVIIELRSGADSVNLSVGPRNFWEKKGIAVQVGDEVTAKGAKAQGQDGKQYLMTQKLVNRTTGSQAELRTAKGEPVWKVGGGSGTGMQRSSGGSLYQNGMIRGGGGGMMMRH
ncbi:DNA-binding protein [Geomonas sp.]|uniref:DNA-binding protein n=1 Tax=Geomonas sp. TaxID=2651584 RepID=UPI002B478A19|nr:DNA-binding protein [Geomonas sp.]HJV37101.1 DNA-binding protein [Geomonas sp.]